MELLRNTLEPMIRRRYDRPEPRLADLDALARLAADYVMPATERELIFERFQRGSGRGTEGGFGLGLAIGSELAARMGGRARADRRRHPARRSG